MKVKIETNENIELTEETLIKAITSKEDHVHEQYADDVLNEFFDYVCKVHKDYVESAVKEVQAIVNTASLSK